MGNPLKETLKAFIRSVGLRDAAVNLKNRKYKGLKRIQTRVSGLDATFSTEDDYSHGWFYPRLANGGIHEQKTTEMMLDSIRGCQCFADVGANIGWFTCLGALLIPDGKVFSFEMDDLNYDILLKNVGINNLRNTEVIHAAVCDKAGTVEYMRSSDAPSPNFSLEGKGVDAATATHVSVQAIALDDFFAEKQIKPDVMKIDVEGAELGVLNGMTRILREDKPTLYLEIHPNSWTDDSISVHKILSMLDGYGYEFQEIEDKGAKGDANLLKPLTVDAHIQHNAMLLVTPKRA